MSVSPVSYHLSVVVRALDRLELLGFSILPGVLCVELWSERKKKASACGKREEMASLARIPDQ